MSFWTEWNESEESYVWDDNQDTQDSSDVPQNDDNTQENETLMDSSAMPQNDNLEPTDFSVNVAEWEKIESFWTSDNEVKNLRWKVDEQDTQDSSLNAQNDEGDANNNPGSALMTDQDWNGEQNENGVEPGLNWELESELIISEVYYDGKDERIEIYNIWNGEFYWDIELSWAIYYANRTSQTYTDIQIPANDFLIIANSDEMFNFDEDVNILLNEWNYKKFSIADTKEIQISLILSWEEVDSFFVHENRVKDMDNDSVSFQKAKTDDWFMVTVFQLLSKEDRKNLVPWMWIVATPWILIWAPEEAKDCTKDPDEPEEEEIMDCGDVYQSPVTVSEIFRWGSRYSPYIEFDIHDDLEWYEFEYLLLTGSALQTPIYIDLLDEDNMYFDIEDLEKNTKLILTTNEWSLTEAGLITIVLQPEFQLSESGWELELYGISRQDRQLLDIVKIGSKISEKSVYRPNSIHECGEVMDNVNDFSPGFNESALKYFSVTSSYNEKVVEKVKYIGGWGGCSCPSKEQLCWKDKGNGVENGSVIWTWNSILTWWVWSWVDSSSQAPQNDKGDANNNPGSVSITDQDWNGEQNENGVEPGLNWEDAPQNDSLQIKIVSLEPKNPESITLQSFIPYDIDFKNHNYYLKTSTSDSKKYIDWILYSKTIDTFSKNFWFVDGWACVYLYSWDSTLDSYCYSEQKPEKQPKEEKSDSFTPSDYQISITYIDYDPEWSDTWKETITIQSNSSKSLDLSKIKMKVNATNKKLTWILEPYSSITLTWSFWFPNSTKDGTDVVVILFNDNYIFSTYKYNPNKPKVEIPDEAVKVYSVIDGDTFRYRKEDGSLQSVRLLGLDAPESNTARYRSTECFWKEAKNYLTNLIKNQYVTLEFDPDSASSDAYGRMLAYVYLDWKLVNETLIAEWYAKEYTYKTSYTQQSAFKQAEENAKRSEKWLRSSSICGKSIEEEPDAWGIDYEKLSIKISNVIYDPDWTDSWNESVQLSVDNLQISAVTSIDFSDDFSLTIFPRSEYATWTTKNKKLSEFWVFDLSSSPDITLKWDFWLPNNRATCVSLNQWSYTFDTRCYNPNWPLTEDETLLSWDTLTSIPNVKIQSIIPNPSWKDSWKEEITLLRTPSEEPADLLNLSPDFSLLINDKTKKKLVWNLVSNQNITIKWSFSFPNSASCVSLLFRWEEIDKFCYSKASDGVKFSSDNSSVHEIPAEELAIVKKITLVKNGDKLCISYNKTQFSCKSIPNSTTEKNKKQLSMQNTFISELEKYIRSNYAMIYYDSNLKDYFELYSNAKKVIKSGDYLIYREWKGIQINNISSLFDKKYEMDAESYFINQISELLPDTLSEKIDHLKENYIWENSELQWLW